MVIWKWGIHRAKLWMSKQTLTTGTHTQENSRWSDFTYLFGRIPRQCIWIWIHPHLMPFSSVKEIVRLMQLHKASIFPQFILKTHDKYWRLWSKWSLACSSIFVRGVLWVPCVHKVHVGICSIESSLVQAKRQLSLQHICTYAIHCTRITEIDFMPFKRLWTRVISWYPGSKHKHQQHIQAQLMSWSVHQKGLIWPHE